MRQSFRQAALDQRQAKQYVVQVVYYWGCEVQRQVSGVQQNHIDVWLRRHSPAHPKQPSAKGWGTGRSKRRCRGLPKGLQIKTLAHNPVIFSSTG